MCRSGNALFALVATGATTVIPDGAEIEVDGTGGIVRILG